MANIYDMADTWNDGLTAFTAIKMNVTDTASASGSLLMDLQVGGTSKFSVDPNGNLTISSGTSAFRSLIFSGKDVGLWSPATELIASGALGNGSDRSGSGFGKFGVFVASNRKFAWSNTTTVESVSGTDLELYRDAADTLAQRRSTNAQTFNLYKTYTDASNYKRGFMKWNGDVLEIGTEADGTGTATARNLRLRSGDNIYLTAATSTDTVQIGFGSGTSTFYYFSSGGFSVAGASNANADLGNSTYRWRDLHTGRSIIFYEQSADPANPAEGRSVVWQSNGTGSGDDGDIMMKITAGGVTETRTLVDFNAPTVTSDTTQAGANTSVVDNIVTITQADYDAIVTPDAATLYVITG